MRIGIYLGDFSPEVGGGFTFQDDVFRAFIKVITDSQHQFIAIGTARNLPEYIKHISSGRNISSININITSLDRISEAIKARSHLSRRLLNHGPIQRIADYLKLDCLWYVAGGGYEVIDTPYFATVWDLQHRATPWFPEMSINGAWDSRELTSSRFLQRASYVITGTEVGKREINSFYQIPDNRIKLLPHPTPNFTLDSKIKFSTDIRSRWNILESYLLYPAQFWPHKNHINLLYAMQVLKDQHNLQIPLILVGSDKGNIEHVKNIANKLNLLDQVIFAGFVTREELIDLYLGAAMLVYPSFCGPENLPPLEAFALGCPVVTSDILGAREQLGDAALFFNPMNPLDIASKIELCLTSDMLANELRTRGRKRAEAWTADDFARGVLQLFDEFSIYRRCW